MTTPEPRRGSQRLIALLLVVGTLSFVGPGAQPVAAQDVEVPSAEAADLARDAVDSDDARAALVAVERVDGRPVDFGSVLGRGQEVAGERLIVLADELDDAPGRTGSTSVLQSEQARSQAEAVLAEDKFQQSDVPKPFKGVLEWLADRLRPVGDFFSWLFGPILALPGGAFILGALFVAGAGFAIGWLVNRRSRAVLTSRPGSGPLVDRDGDPEDLDRRASDAETSGAHGEAVRLRYQAGLLRLARSGRLTLRAETTAADAARQVDHDDMWALTSDFEQIVYGNRDATATDVSQARQRWTSLLASRVDA